MIDWSKLIIATTLSMCVFMISAFAAFSAFRYLDKKDDLPERILFIVMAIIGISVGVLCFVGIINS